jgi:hypothetical protein
MLMAPQCPTDLCTTNELRPWQQEAKDMLTQLPEDDRKIHFYYDPAGAAGKTWFIRYMFSQDPENVQILGNGTYDNLAHAIIPTKRIYLFNIPRNGMQYLPYRVLEGLKDRAIMSNKYMSQMKILQYQPHVCRLKVFPPECRFRSKALSETTTKDEVHQHRGR